MKKIITILLLFVLYNYGHSQNTGIIEYTYTSYGDYQIKMELMIKDGKSKFVFHKEPKVINADGDMTLYHYYEHFESYYDYATKKMVERRTLDDNTVLIADWTSDLKWEITDETREILGYKVRKATARAYGSDKKSWESHDYAIAWFAPEIPVPSGPEKYVGLPGLILKLEFDKGVLREYTCTGINFNKNTDFAIPTDGIKVSQNQILNPEKIDKKWLKKQKGL